MKKMMFLSKNWYFSVQKALIYYTVKSHHNSFILLVFLHVANFRFLTLDVKIAREPLNFLSICWTCGETRYPPPPHIEF